MQPDSGRRNRSGVDQLAYVVVLMHVDELRRAGQDSRTELAANQQDPPQPVLDLPSPVLSYHGDAVVVIATAMSKRISGLTALPTWRTETQHSPTAKLARHTSKDRLEPSGRECDTYGHVSLKLGCAHQRTKRPIRCARTRQKSVWSVSHTVS